jgi:hypothetical protein
VVSRNPAPRVFHLHHTMNNINTKQFWEENFQDVDGKSTAREEQTRSFAESQIQLFDIGRDFDGTILDFGCALGDAIPVYHKAYPQANLMGLDISANAIKRCTEKYGEIATFISGDHRSVPVVDIVIASNVFEHLSNDLEIARVLLSKCQTLYIIVPYKEQIVPNDEHVNSYDDQYFAQFSPYESTVFLSRGWTQYGFKLVYEIYLKNIVKGLLLRNPRTRSKQIMFKLTNLGNPPPDVREQAEWTR